MSTPKRGRLTSDDETSTLSDLLVRLVLDANRYVAAAAKVSGLGSTDLLALCHLRAGPMAPGEVGDRLVITSASMTVLADRLERDGRLRRRSHPSDRRKLQLIPTSRGTRQARTVMDWLAQDVAVATAGLTAAECRSIGRFLKRMSARLNERADQALSPGGPASAGIAQPD